MPDLTAGRTSLLTFPMFTRTGPQCAVCSAWKMPCVYCAAAPSAVVSQEELLASIFNYFGYEPAIEEMAEEAVRTGSFSDRLARAKKQIGVAEQV